MPTRHRDVLVATAAGELTLTKHPHGCLMVFPRPEWEKFRERIAQLPMSAQWWKRIFLGNAQDVELDGTGRVLVSPELRQAAGLTREAEIQQMVKDAELNAAEDHKKLELVQARNQGDAMAHSVRKSLTEHGDKLDAGEKEQIEAAPTPRAIRSGAKPCWPAPLA